MLMVVCLCVLTGCAFMCVSVRNSARPCVLMEDVYEMLERSRCKLRKSIRLEKELWRWLEGGRVDTRDASRLERERGFR